MARTDQGRILFVFDFTCVVGKNLNTPRWSSMTDDAITWDSTGGQGYRV